MKCPNCDHRIGWGFIEDECIDPNVTFECPECQVKLRYFVDEGTYYCANVIDKRLKEVLGIFNDLNRHL